MAVRKMKAYGFNIHIIFFVFYRKVYIFIVCDYLPALCYNSN